MRTYLLAAAALALLGAAAPVEAIDPPLVLQPSSPWVVNYAVDSCRLIRTFGEGDQRVRLEFRTFAPEKWFWLLVSGEPVGSGSSAIARLRYRFDPDSRDIAGYALRGKLDEKTYAVMFQTSFETRDAREAESKAYRRDREAYESRRGEFDLEREAKVDALEIGLTARRRIVLKLGTMRPPMDAARACLDDLLESWGVDAKIQKSLTRPAVPIVSPENWLKSSDFPQKMFADGLNDSVNFRLTVDPTGMPTDCSVLTMESKPAFIKATCDTLMKRARFKPALNSQGKPVASIYVNTVIWRS